MCYLDKNMEELTNESIDSSENDVELLKKLSKEHRVENFCSTYQALEKSFSVPFTKKRGFPFF